MRLTSRLKPGRLGANQARSTTDRIEYQSNLTKREIAYRLSSPGESNNFQLLVLLGFDFHFP